MMTFGLCSLKDKFSAFLFYGQGDPTQDAREMGRAAGGWRHCIFSSTHGYNPCPQIAYYTGNRFWTPYSCLMVFPHTLSSLTSGTVVLIDEWMSGPMSEKIKWSLGKYIGCTHTWVPSYISKDRILLRMRIYPLLELLAPFRVEKYFTLIWKRGWRWSWLMGNIHPGRKEDVLRWRVFVGRIQK